MKPVLMPNFIILHRDTNGRRVLVNPDHISSMEEVEDSSGTFNRILTLGGTYLEVKETPMEVIVMIQTGKGIWASTEAQR